MRRQVFDTKRRLTQKLKNAFEAPSDASALAGGLDDEYKNMKKLEIQELKKMLVRLAGAIKSHINAISAISDSSGMISSCMMELAVEKREHQSKGYVHAGIMQEASATMEVSGRTSLETLRDAHESLIRKIADFKTVEKQISEYETALLDIQAYDRKLKDAEAAKEACVAAGKGGVEAAQAKLDKVSFKLSQSKAGYNSVKESLWGAFEWYQRAGGLLAAQEAEALRAAQLSFFEASAAALRRVPAYGPAELTADLNSCSTDPNSNGYDNSGSGGFDNPQYSPEAEEEFFGSNPQPPLVTQDSENDLFQASVDVDTAPVYEETLRPPPPPPPPVTEEEGSVYPDVLPSVPPPEYHQDEDGRPPPPPPPAVPPSPILEGNEDLSLSASRPSPPPPPPPPPPPQTDF